MILDVKIFDESLLISTEGMSEDVINFIINVVLDGYSVHRGNMSIIVENPEPYNVFLALNEHYSILII